jgi:hypothetical protein
VEYNKKLIMMEYIVRQTFEDDQLKQKVSGVSIEREYGEWCVH